eukprot:7645795-Alexandrium_andersonii.AAC.1
MESHAARAPATPAWHVLPVQDVERAHGLGGMQDSSCMWDVLGASGSHRRSGCALHNSARCTELPRPTSKNKEIPDFPHLVCLEDCNSTVSA